MNTSRKNSEKSSLYMALLFIGVFSLAFMIYMDTKAKKKIVAEIDSTIEFIEQNQYVKPEDKPKDLEALSAFRAEVNRTLFFQVRSRQRQEESIAGTAAMVQYSIEKPARQPSASLHKSKQANKNKHSGYSRKKIASRS